MVTLNLFYLLAGIALISSIMVISARNPVHSVLFLILAFFNAAGLLILMEMEFLSLIFIVVYVGAIAVLFLFVVMMLNVKISEVEDEVLQYLPVGGTIGLIFLFLIFFIIEGDFVSFNGQANSIYLDWFQQVDVVSNIETLGQVLYTEYLVYFLLAGVILLVAMVGAIVLTMSTRTSLRRQLIFQQVSRDFDNSTLLV
jgi:NADH-quinone oxidoreductase subunit J|tara:strand:+ start:1196 stop:1789 length:594 start_codon:yes stop_codon:yes gene_type:complete